MNLKNEGQNEWNDSYLRGGNVCFYPHEEIIRFVNKYVRKKLWDGSYQNIMNLSDDDWNDFRSLDLGCGMGRHVNFLDEFHLNPYGIDLSDTAIDMGKQWLKSMEKEKLVERLVVGSVAELPFPDNYFTICVSHGVLDSMPREIARAGLKETYRVLKTGGMMYLDLIMDALDKDKDEIVADGYEKDTVQSYFNIETIKSFIGDEAEIVEFKIITWQNDLGMENHRRAHLIIKKK